jgi:hypothetical protein
MAGPLALRRGSRSDALRPLSTARSLIERNADPQEVKDASAPVEAAGAPERALVPRIDAMHFVVRSDAEVIPKLSPKSYEKGGCRPPLSPTRGTENLISATDRLATSSNSQTGPVGLSRRDVHGLRRSRSLSDLMVLRAITLHAVHESRDENNA